MYRPWAMRIFLAWLLLSIPVVAQPATPALPSEDRIRITEFYRVAAEIQDRIWPGWSKIPAPLLLVTNDTEFLTHHPGPPTEFKKLGDDFYVRPRKFPVSFQATFPAFGPPSVIVVGEPVNTISKTSTVWLFMLMHEHFHQLQNAQPGYFQAVNDLGLSHGDTTGMWMLNYPFPYEKPEVARAFAELRDLLVQAVNENDAAKFQALAKKYGEQRKKFFALLSPDDRKYLGFQLWQEGIARYTEVKSAEAASDYRPTEAFSSLSDFEPFKARAENARAATLAELKRADITTWKREVVYSFGAAEGFLLDRLNPGWKEQYFQRMLSTDSYFDAAQ